MIDCEITDCYFNKFFAEIQLKKTKFENNYSGIRIWTPKPVHWSPNWSGYIPDVVRYIKDIERYIKSIKWGGMPKRDEKTKGGKGNLKVRNLI